MPNFPTLDPEFIPTITFGFEWELDQNAEGVTRYLYDNDRSIMPMAEMHRYHCDCNTCSFHSGYMLRAQTDSSCSGEIISSVFTNMNQARSVMTLLEEAATQVDGEPGWRSGFHVHVSKTHLQEYDYGLGLAFYEFLRWEPVLVQLSRGRFYQQRDNNRSVRGEINRFIADYAPDTRPRLSIESALRSYKNHPSYMDQLLLRHSENDRHSNLNLTTRHNTWEFRLWNSTRSAWRMELWCWLSLAMMNPVVLEVLSEKLPSLKTFRIGIEAHPFAEQILPLLDKQITYQTAVENGTLTPEDSFTVIR